VSALPPGVRRIASRLIGVRNLLKKVLALSLRNVFQKRPLFLAASGGESDAPDGSTIIYAAVPVSF